MDFLFDIRKAIAAAAYLCKMNGGTLNVLHLIKMLYYADRTALVTWHRTITGDRFFSMKNGPILSRVYDLMCGRISGADMQAWSSTFTPRHGNVIALKRQEVDFGPLSRREMEALGKAFNRFKVVPAGRLVEFLHKNLPEWEDPGDSSAPIDPKTILLHEGLTEEDLAAIEEELALVQSARIALQAV